MNFIQAMQKLIKDGTYAISTHNENEYVIFRNDLSLIHSVISVNKPVPVQYYDSVWKVY